MVTQNYNYSVEKQAVVRIFLYASVGKQQGLHGVLTPISSNCDKNVWAFGSAAC